MKITGFDVHTIEIPMRMSVDHALAKRTSAVNVLVRARSDDGESGWGESCPRPYVTGESVESVWADLVERFLPPLIGQEFDGLPAATELLSGMLGEVQRNQQAAFCAAELAVLDLVGRSTGESAGAVLGPVQRAEVVYSGVLATVDLDKVRQLTETMKKFGLQEVKVKTVESLETNREILGIAREILGADVSIRLDANAAWDADEAIRQLDALMEFSIVGVEQPVPGGDLSAMKAVTAAGIVPVVADESLCSLEDARMLVAERGCDVFNVRISKCGGLINAGRIHQVALDGGLVSQLGAQVGETGILSAAGRQFATRSSSVRWCEGSYGGLLLEQDITDPDVTIGPRGVAPALEGPGLGVVPIEERLSARITKSSSIP